MQYEFTTKVNIESHTGLNKSLNIPDDIDVEVRRPDMYVNWGIDFEMREWGIKSIATNIINVYGEVEVEVFSGGYSENDKKLLIAAGFTEMRDDTFYFRHVLHTRNSPMEIIDEIEINSDTIYPTEIEIDFANKKIIVR